MNYLSWSIEWIVGVEYTATVLAMGKRLFICCMFTFSKWLPEFIMSAFKTADSYSVISECIHNR